MVLTNFECWAHGETADAVNFETGPGARHSTVVDPFNARVVSHIASASNGYYGYAIVNNAAADNNNNSCNNNNLPQAASMEVVSNDAAVAGAVRCKKRCFAMGHHEHDEHELDMEMDNLTAVKRCRFDDADLVAQYCNDFFSLPATQVIGTQACLMDLDYNLQQQQQQQLQHHHQQQQQSEQQTAQLQQQQQQHPRIHQHYQAGPQQEQEQQLSKCDKLDDKSEIESEFTVEAAADLYIATHGGCRHHYPCRPVETDEEFDI